MGIRNRLRREHKNPHSCNQNTGFSFFFWCVKHPSCGVDWQTETAVCSDCGTLLCPPKWLRAYNHFGVRWQGLVAIYLTVVLVARAGLIFPRNALVVFLSYAVFGHLIPAALAAFGTWESFYLPGLLPAEALESQRAMIEKRRQLPYHRAVRYSLGIIFLLLIVYALELRD